MYKSIIIALGAILSLGAVIALIFGGNDISKEAYANATQEEKEAILSSMRVDKKIDYTKTSPTVIPSKGAIGGGNPNSKTKRKSTVIAYERVSEYTVVIDDPNINNYDDTFKGYVTIQASIDNQSFSLRVPKQSIKNYSDAITLQITNTKTGIKQSAPASFLSEISTTPGTIKDSVTIDPNNPSNTEHTQKNSILP